MECKWGVHRRETNLCGDIQYVIGYICDKCGDKQVIEICAVHHDMWVLRGPTFRCQHCGGTMSWQIRDLNTEEQETRINTTEL